ncbi:MAG: hypothetical protein K2O14_03255 [Oscillospiraceae bacterium]|nr:hypothetical protein [Oscillospiraceae bacterium]
MENVITLHMPQGDKPAPAPENPAETEIKESVVPAESEEKSDEPVRRVRQPLLRRRGNLLLMGLASVCGAACGGVMMFRGADFSALSQAFVLQAEGSFLSFFLSRVIYGGIFLLAEYILGYFALGEWIVWAVPMCCGTGAALTLAASAEGASGWLLLPSAAMTAVLAVFGANTSGDMSALLLRIAAGKNGSFVMSESAARDYTLHFLGYAVLLALAGLYDGVIGIL